MSAGPSEHRRVESETIRVAVNASSVAHISQQLAPESSRVVPPGETRIVIGSIALKATSRRQVTI